MDEKDLKIQALLERIAALTSNYEDQDANRRVLLTTQTAQIESLQQQLEAVNSREENNVVQEETTPAPSSSKRPKGS